MLDDALIEELNRGYICPPEAGPAWRAAHDSGLDMSLIEESLMLTPWERLLANDRALALVRMVEQATPVKDGTAH
jgi:hypothetical protein